MRRNYITSGLATIIFTAIIYLISLLQFHVSSPIGDPYVQIGEAVGIIAVLFLGLRLGLLSSLVGIMVANFNSNFSFFYLPMFEMLIIGLIANFLFNLLGKKPHWTTIITVSLGCGITKVVTTFLHYFIQVFISSDYRFSGSIVGALAAMPAGIITAILIVIVTPILYLILHRIVISNSEQ